MRNAIACIDEEEVSRRRCSSGLHSGECLQASQDK